MTRFTHRHVWVRVCVCAWGVCVCATSVCSAQDLGLSLVLPAVAYHPCPRVHMLLAHVSLP